MKNVPNLFKGNMSGEPCFKYEEEAKYFWIELKRIEYDETTHQIKTESKKQCFSGRDWNDMQNMEKNLGIHWLAAANWHEFVILHDPSIVYDLETLKI